MKQKLKRRSQFVRRTANAIMLFATCLLGCPGFGDKTLEELSPPVMKVVTWESDISAILTAKCAVCHTAPSVGGAPADFRLDRYDRTSAGGMTDGAYEKADRIKARAIDAMTMPPSGSPALTDEERNLLKTWLENAAPLSENGPTWNLDVGPIIVSRCGGCHSESPTGGAPSSFRLDIYSQTEGGGGTDGAFEKKERIRVRALESKTMPPGGPLSSEEQITLQRWLDAGAPLE